MISTSEIKISVLIDEKDAERAVQIIHSKFNWHERQDNRRNPVIEAIRPTGT